MLPFAKFPPVRPKQKKAAVRPKKTAPTSDAPDETLEALRAQLDALAEENQRLQREVDNLRVDREILKKAAAFSASRKG